MTGMLLQQFFTGLEKPFPPFFSPDVEVAGFAVDSRLILPGFIFFALKGEKVDGHEFLLQALERGAICAVVSKECQQKIPGLFLIFVDDVLASLQKLARWWLSCKNSSCIAVTGSVGKTTTKEFLATLLSGSFIVKKTPGNANSQVGLPLGILNERKDAEVFIAEMGMSSKGEISSLVSIAPPDIAIITHVSLAHAHNFPRGVEEVAEAKAEILSHPKTKKAFLHAQMRSFAPFSKSLFFPFDVVFYGKGSEITLLQEGNLWRVKTDSEISSPFPLPFSAQHLRENFLGALLVAKELGVALEDIVERSAHLSPSPMRFETLVKGGVTYVNDAYNASPASMKAALENLPTPTRKEGKVIAVLGEMKELGIFSKQAHEEIGHVAAKHADVLMGLGPDCKGMVEAFSETEKKGFFFSSLQEVKKELGEIVQEGDVVLIKASNSVRLWTILE
jgi:UDP-N-acetylmuramoyl-tripeptide--D-alanyl-D-alanine ligase